MYTAHALTFEKIELFLGTDGDFHESMYDREHFDSEEEAVFAAQQAAKPCDAIVKVYAKEVDLED